MVDGLVVEREDFLSLPHKEQHLVMYNNLLEIRKIGVYNKYKQRIIMAWLGALSAIGAWFMGKFLWLS